MDPYPAPPVPDLQWSHVLFSLTFVGVNSLISWSLHLHVGASLVIAAGRCMVQLTVVAAVLQRVFATKNSITVAVIAAGTFLLVGRGQPLLRVWQCLDPQVGL
jgi:ABC-type iron transport system FetAB permease component